MRKRILELLRNSKGTPVSGEEISKELEVSRTAIWKHIQALKNEATRLNLCLSAVIFCARCRTVCSRRKFLSRLQTKWLGRNICYRDSVDSSNTA